MAKKLTILDKITEIEKDPTHTKLNEIQQLAIRIILHGTTHKDWDTFIGYFVDQNNPDQLARLRLKDSEASKAYIRQTVAYLVANSTCGGSTGGKLHINIDSKLDKGIPYNSPAPIDSLKIEDSKKRPRKKAVK